MFKVLVTPVPTQMCWRGPEAPDDDDVDFSHGDAVVTVVEFDTALAAVCAVKAINDDLEETSHTGFLQRAVYMGDIMQGVKRATQKVRARAPTKFSKPV